MQDASRRPARSASGGIFARRRFGSVGRLANHSRNSGGNVPAATIDTSYVGQ
jgi:hypothetical protein